MNKKPEEPHFNMSQAALALTAIEKLRFLRRDLAELAERGMTEDRINRLNALNDVFVAMPTEGEGVQLTADATLAKDEQRVLVLSAMQSIMSKVRLRNGDTTPAYKAFGTAGLNSAADSEVYVGMVRVVRVGRLVLETYKNEGLTAGNLDELESLNSVFLLKIGQAHDLAASAEAATQKRLRAANEVYDTLVNDCEVGKATYVQTDVAKYNDYVIYDTPTAAAPPVPLAEAVG